MALDSIAGDATKAVTTAVVTEPLASATVEQPTKQSDTDGVGGTRESAEVKVGEPQPVEAKPDEVRSVEAKSDDAKSPKAKPVETTVVATKPVETKPAEVKQAEAKPEAKPVEARSIPITAPARSLSTSAPNDARDYRAEANGRPISVFVSLKENKLYVRQHVAVSHAPGDGADNLLLPALSVRLDDVGGLRWTVVSIPSSYRRVAEAKNSDSGRKGRRQEHAVKAVEIVAPMPSPNPSPSAALDRIIMPPELVERIAEMITPGSSLIVSDKRLSDETGEYTDFIVLTR